MKPEELRQLVEQTVRAVLAARAGAACACATGGECACGGSCACASKVVEAACGCAKSPAMPRQRVVFLFTGAESGEREGRQLLARARRSYECEVVIAPCYSSRHGEKWLIEDAAGAPIHHAMTTSEIENLLRRTSVLVVPHPTRTTLAKVAAGVADSLASEMILAALMGGVPVVSGTGDGEAGNWPATTPAKMRNGPGSLGERMRRCLDSMEDWGAVIRRTGELWAPVDKLARAGENREARSIVVAGVIGPTGTAATRRFITAVDVQTAHREGRHEIVLGPNDRATDEARALADGLGVDIRGGIA